MLHIKSALINFPVKPCQADWLNVMEGGNCIPAVRPAALECMCEISKLHVLEMQLRKHEKHTVISILHITYYILGVVVLLHQSVGANRP